MEMESIPSHSKSRDDHCNNYTHKNLVLNPLLGA